MLRYLSAILFSVLLVSPAFADGSAYDRVMKDHVLHCGYISWPPYLQKDVKTGEVSGFYKDYMDYLGRAFNLKVEWTSEVSMTDIPSALGSGKIDAFCIPLGAVPTRAVNMEFSEPVMYLPIDAYVRKDDKRFDDHVEKIDDAGVTLSVMEGEYAGILARTTFPKAKLLEITEIQGSGTLFTNVANRKADIIFQDPGTFAEYNKANPGILRKVKNGRVGVVPVAFMVQLGDTKMKRLLDYGNRDLQSRFIVHRLVKQYGVGATKQKEADFLEPAIGYQPE